MKSPQINNTQSTEFKLNILSSLKDKHIYIIICILVGLAYYNSLYNGFVWDDEEQIVNNSVIKNVLNLQQILTSSTFNTGGAGLNGAFYRPFVSIYYMLMYQTFGLSANYYHLIQVILHSINTILVYKILKKIRNNEKTLSFILSGIYGIHPITIETVSYIGSIGDIFHTLSTLLITHIFIYIGVKDYNRHTLALKISFLMLSAMLFKESAIYLLPYIIILSYYFMKDKALTKNLILINILVLSLYLIIRLGIAEIPFSNIGHAPIAKLSLIERLINLPIMLTYYFKQILIPASFSISQHWYIRSARSMEFLISFIILMFLVVTTIKTWLKQSSDNFRFFSLSFIISILLILNIYPLDMTVADRWFYLPFIMLLGTIATFLDIYFGKYKLSKPIQQLILCVIMITVTLLTYTTHSRNKDWMNGYSLYSQDIKVNPDSYDLQNNYGVELYRKGDITAAQKHFKASIELNTDYWFAHNNLGATYQAQGNYEQAIYQYQKTLQISDYYLAYENLTSIYLITNRLSEAEIVCQEALYKLPNNPKLNVYMALVKYKLNKKDEAKYYAYIAYKLNPNSETAKVLEAINSNIDIEF